MTKFEMIKEMLNPWTPSQIRVAKDIAQRNSKKYIELRYQMWKLRKEQNK